MEENVPVSEGPPHLSALHPDLRLRVVRCQGAPERVAHVQPAASSVAESIEDISKVLGNRRTRLGVIGGTQYSFPPSVYHSSGVAAVQQICEAAAAGAASAAASAWTHLLVGGSWSGPQRTFAEAFAQTPATVVHVLPNTGEAIVDLIHLLFDDYLQESKPRVTTAKFVFVGGSYRVRNCVLAALCAQLFVCGGGPGTHLEVVAARGAGTGLLPLVRSGGLVEGQDFSGRSVRGIGRALRDVPPPDLQPRHWRTILGYPIEEAAAMKCFRRWCGRPKDNGDASGKATNDAEEPLPAPADLLPSLQEYLEAVRSGFSMLRPYKLQESATNAALPVALNLWPFSPDEKKDWEEQLVKLQQPTDLEKMH